MASARSTAQQARLNRAKRFAKCGDWSRSLAALEAGELAPPSSETVVALSSKHPPAAAEIPDWVHTFTPAAAPQLTVPVLHAALQSAPRGTAAGPSEWFIEYLRDTFLSQQQHLPSLLHVFQNWLQGDLPPAVRPFYTASNLVALQKPHGGVRPIAIGEVLPRLLSRCITLLFKQQMRETFLPHLQFGVGVPAWIEIMSHAVCSAFSLHPDWVVLHLDVANAFNSFNRVSMFEALRRSPFSSLIPFFRLFYSTPSPLHYRSGPLLHTFQARMQHHELALLLSARLLSLPSLVPLLPVPPLLASLTYSLSVPTLLFLPFLTFRSLPFLSLPPLPHLTLFSLLSLTPLSLLTLPYSPSSLSPSTTSSPSLHSLPSSPS
ncbi:unnamed protein product [Closterium sp. NIES-64]|nr:unnamed protein product [Closterium sp. NIES-64]